MRRKTKTFQSQELNFKDLLWCIENDFQVYLVPLSSCGKREFKIAVRRNGITTSGLDYKLVNGRPVNSVETLTERTFKNQAEARDYLNYTYKYLRSKYG